MVPDRRSVAAAGLCEISLYAPYPAPAPASLRGPAGRQCTGRRSASLDFVGLHRRVDALGTDVDGNDAAAGGLGRDARLQAYRAAIGYDIGG